MSAHHASDGSEISHLVQVALERAGANPEMAQRIVHPDRQAVLDELVGEWSLRDPSKEVALIRWEEHRTDRSLELAFSTNHHADIFVLDDLAGAPPRLMRQALSVISTRTMDDYAHLLDMLMPHAHIYIIDSGDPVTDGYRGLLNKHPRIQTVRRREKP